MKIEQKMSRLFIELPPDKHRQLRIIAATEGKTMKEIILECIETKAASSLSTSPASCLAPGLAASCLAQPRTEG